MKIQDKKQSKLKRRPKRAWTLATRLEHRRIKTRKKQKGLKY